MDSNMEETGVVAVEAEESGAQLALTPIQVQPFCQPTRPQVNISNVVKDVFFLFFTSSSLEHIVRQSNIYAGEMLREQFAQGQLHTTGAVCIHGFHDLNGYHSASLREYWKKDEVYHYSAVANRISHESFLVLHRYLYFVDTTTSQRTTLKLHGATSECDWNTFAPVAYVHRCKVHISILRLAACMYTLAVVYLRMGVLLRTYRARTGIWMERIRADVRV